MRFQGNLPADGRLIGISRAESKAVPVKIGFNCSSRRISGLRDLPVDGGDLHPPGRHRESR